MCVLLVCNRRQPCVDHLPLPETPDAFQKEQLGPKWFSSCGDKHTSEDILVPIKHAQACITHFEVRTDFQTNLQVPESEDHRLGEIYPVGSSVHRSRDDM